MAGLPLLQFGNIRLEPLAESHREALREACAEDPAIWEIYSFSMLGEAFDRWWEAGSAAGSERLMWAILVDDRLVGMTGIFPEDRTPGVVEIGATYIVPGVRGTRLNRMVKWLVLSHVFRGGFHRVEFRVDARNLRSQAAVLKLGATRDGILRHHKITHTGHIRDTHVFAITDADWRRIEPELRPEQG